MSDKPTMMNSGTDWERVDGLTDDEIDTSDIPPLTQTFFKRARLRVPQQQVIMTMHIDVDVLDWFQAQGEDYQERMQAALRIYAEAHQGRLH